MVGPVRGAVKPLADFAVTLLLWTYFLAGFLLCFAPLFAAAAILCTRREAAFQALNHYFYRGFFGLLSAVAPGLKWRIDPQVRSLRGAVVVCNHLSYLDPILLIALFRRQKTLVKARFFRMPIFGWFMRGSGYLPAGGGGNLEALMLERLWIRECN